MRYMRALPFLLVLLIVLFAGLKPDPVPQVFHHQDKLHHLALQGALPYRTPSLGDMLANGLGVGCGLLASLMLRGWLARVEGRLVAASGA